MDTQDLNTAVEKIVEDWINKVLPALKAQLDKKIFAQVES